MNELLPSFQDDVADAADSTGAMEALQNGTLRGPQGLGTPMFPAVDELLALFKDSCQELVDLRQQVVYLMMYEFNMLVLGLVPMI